MGLTDNIMNIWHLATGASNQAPVEERLPNGQRVDSPKGSVLPYNLKAVSQTQQDIKTWKRAEMLMMQEEMPRTYALQILFNQIMKDTRLSSQVKNRMAKSLGAGFTLKNANGEINEEQTKLFRKMPVYRKLVKAILSAQLYGHTVGELRWAQNKDGALMLDWHNIPRTNIVPREGKFYSDYAEERFIKYRELEEFGTWILEFRSDDDDDEFGFGLLNKVVPHVLFKRFAQSCWSELCEIYGIPPRVLKTNTHDKSMLTRSEKMMKDTGAAAWYIIDQSEDFEFAKGVSTDGDVYGNFIRLCNEEISMNITGAIVGQDTKNGSNAKEQSSQGLLTDLVMGDLELLEQTFNAQVLPALILIGALPKGLTLEYDPIEDTDQLWTRTKEALPYAEVDPDWMKDKFGLMITGMRNETLAPPAKDDGNDAETDPKNKGKKPKKGANLSADDFI
jgi:phage gp29-like protein